MDDGIIVLIKKSKTDQEAQGREVDIPTGSSKATDPVLALQAWLGAAGIERGPRTALSTVMAMSRLRR